MLRPLLLLVSLLLWTTPSLAEEGAPGPTDLSTYSDPSRIARTRQALDLLNAIDPRYSDTASQLRILLVPKSLLGQTDGVYYAGLRLVALNEAALPCPLAALLAHELTHARRVGIGEDALTVKPRQARKEDFAEFLLDEEAQAFKAQIAAAQALGCLAEQPPALVSLARAAGAAKDDAEWIGIFRRIYPFVALYRASYEADFETLSPGIAAR